MSLAVSRMSMVVTVQDFFIWPIASCALVRMGSVLRMVIEVFRFSSTVLRWCSSEALSFIRKKRRPPKIDERQEFYKLPLYLMRQGAYVNVVNSRVQP